MSATLAQEALVRQAVAVVDTAEQILLHCARGHIGMETASEEEKEAWSDKWDCAKDRYLASRKRAVELGAQLQLPQNIELLQSAADVRREFIAAELEADEPEGGNSTPAPDPATLPTIVVARRPKGQPRMQFKRRTLREFLRDDGLWDDLDDLLHWQQEA